MNKQNFPFFVLLAMVSGAFAQEVMTVDNYKAEAARTVDEISVAMALDLVDEDDVVFVDVREGDELERLGSIKGATHIPRGVLEFQIDPGSSMHREFFASGKKVIFYCATGGRSMLAAKLAHDMGVANPVYLEGGFSAWSKAEGPTEE